MTSKKWKLLSAEQQQLKVAELCGYTLERKAGWLNFPMWFKGDDVQTQGLPDFLNDLNAMHEAWLTKIAENNVLCSKFCYFLGQVLRPLWTDDKDFIWFYSRVENATAEQRAEAFVLTLEPEETET
jgi:hypothetical protein